MAKCLRCGAPAEYLEGALLSDDEELELLTLPLREARRRFEVWYFINLRNKFGRISAVADASGLDRSWIYDKLYSLGLIQKKRERTFWRL